MYHVKGWFAANLHMHKSKHVKDFMDESKKSDLYSHSVGSTSTKIFESIAVLIRL